MHTKLSFIPVNPSTRVTNGWSAYTSRDSRSFIPYRIQIKQCVLGSSEASIDSFVLFP